MRLRQEKVFHGMHNESLILYPPFVDIRYHYSVVHGNQNGVAKLNCLKCLRATKIAFSSVLV